MKRIRVVTHGGSAHRDEYLAICAILHYEHATNGRLAIVERRIFTPHDLECDSTWVVDTGMRWEPELLNFDHHQDDARVVDRCALDLVLAHIMGDRAHAQFRKHHAWLGITACQDTRGPGETAQQLGIDVRVYSSLKSPVEKFILQRFADATTIVPDSALHAEMRELGRLVLNSIVDMDSLRESLHQLPHPLDHGGIRVWDVRSAQSHDNAVDWAVVNEVAGSRSADVVVGRNLRLGKVCLYRQHWAEHKLDFARLEGHPLVISSHKNGFYAVVNAEVTDGQLVELLALARIEAVA